MAGPMTASNAASVDRMAEPLPKDVGSERERRARLLWGRNMFLVGTLFGGLLGAGITLGLTEDTGDSSAYLGGVIVLLVLWFLSRGGGSKG